MKKTFTRWYVFPHNKSVNNVIFLAVDNAESSFAGELNCKGLTGNKLKVPLWEVPYQVITALKANKDVNNKFTVFVRESNGLIRQFDPAKSRKLSQKK